ncbi:MaoC family dehydratase N-terminal domain-containing protein [Chloroflexota bacterium]
MAIRGEYTEDEKKMISQVEELRGKVTYAGEVMTPDNMYPVFYGEISRSAIRRFCEAIGDENPLFRDAEYARFTRWGGIIAPPMFLNCITATFGAPHMLRLPDSLILLTLLNVGSTVNWYKPLRLDDSFVVKDVWYSGFEDKTRKDGKGPRTLFATSDRLYYNQSGELAALAKRKRFYVIAPKPKEGEAPPRASSMPMLKPYVYSDEELEWIYRVYDKEEIRGGEPRFWEDVNVGDDLIPVVDGPRDIWHIMHAFEFTEFTPNALLTRKRWKRAGVNMPVGFRDPVTNLPRQGGEVHLDNWTAQKMGVPLAIGFGVQNDFALGRLLTNWMSDEGFLKKYESQNRIIDPLGDTMFGKGKVIKKYEEDGEHLVDIAVWCECIRGYIAAMGTATVVLPSRTRVI